MMKPIEHPLGTTVIRELQIWRVGALPGLLVIALILLARLSGNLEFFEWMALDYFLRLRPAEATDERVLIVGINEEDIGQIGTYPVPDQHLATLIRQLQQHQPAVIGVDIVRDIPVEPGHDELTALFQANRRLLGIESILPDRQGLTIKPPPGLSPEQVGFADVILDADGSTRRNLLGDYNPQGEYRFSLPLRLAEIYLSDQGVALDNGIRDPAAMRFGSTELTRFRNHSGGYVGENDRGNQILLNFRSGRTPFRLVSMGDVMDGTVPSEWIRDRIILIGIIATSTKDVFHSAAVHSSNPGLVYGVEIHAHTVSQIISAVLDKRPLLRGWPDGWEYGWITVWGILGISLGRIFTSPVKILLSLAIASCVLISVCYGALLLGWWIPFIPSMLGLLLNGAGLTATLFYRYQQDLKSRLQERQRVIDQSFDAIHNGPLQTLSQLLREVKENNLSSDQIYSNLEGLNQELRSVYESIRKETLVEDGKLYLANQLGLSLEHPLQELLYEVYSDTLVRDLPGFKTIKVTITDFDAIDGRWLTIEQRKGLCRFLEEALCNVGKHAVAATRLEVVVKQENGQNYIRVTDNGAGSTDVSGSKSSEGWGSRQARNLARQLNGKFRRSPNSPQGTTCELSWPATRPWFWWF